MRDIGASSGSAAVRIAHGFVAAMIRTPAASTREQRGVAIQLGEAEDGRAALQPCELRRLHFLDLDDQRACPDRIGGPLDCSARGAIFGVGETARGARLRLDGDAWPACVSARTPSGTSATRRSPSLISRGMPMRIVPSRAMRERIVDRREHSAVRYARSSGTGGCRLGAVDAFSQPG